MEIRLISTLKGFAKIFVPFLAMAGILTVSCNNEASKQAILSEEKMVTLMKGIYISEQKVSRLGIPQDSALQVFAVLETKLLKDAGVSDSIFRKSLDYYQARPEKMQQIYTALVDSLQLEEQKTSGMQNQQ